MQSKPNILWLTTDHQAFANHYNVQPQFTRCLPTLDKLCADGVFFDNAYTSCPLCTPARASMLTGVYPHRHALMLNPDAKDPDCRNSFDKEEELFAFALKKQGYRAVQLGKWHVGDKLANKLGFEGWTLPGYGNPLHTQEYRAYLERNNLPEPVVRVLWDAFDPALAGQEFNLMGDYQPFSAARELLTPKETHEAYFIADMACRWLDEYATGEEKQPFMLKVDVWGPHHPYDTAPPFKGRVNPALLHPHPSFNEVYQNKPYNYTWTKNFWKHIDYMDWEQTAQVLAVCYEHAMLVDDALGQVLTRLDNLGFSDNTLVILTSDHGDIFGAHGGLFNKETLLVEETMRIPLVLRWPGCVLPGTRDHRLSSNMDIPATVLAAADAEPHRAMDGIDLLGETRREHLMCETYGCYQKEFVQRLLRWQQYKYVAHYKDSDELYDLAQDPFELHNLIDDTRYVDILQEMQERLLREMRISGDTGIEATAIQAALGANECHCQ